METGGRSTGRGRVSDRDRDRALDALKEHAADGTLTLEEFTVRVEGVLLALTRDEVDRLLADLPRAPHPVEQTPAAGRPIDSLPSAGTVTVMFVDMCDYSGLHYRLGDAVARRVAAAYLRVVRGQVSRHEGIEIKCNGDGLMVAFHSAVAAVRCANAVQHALDGDDGYDGSDERPRAHIGIHAGEVIREDDDLHGATVILASRLAESAAPGEIVTSALTRELCRAAPELDFAGPRSSPLKGIGDHDTYSVTCRPS